jgi:hypothetical protein
VTDFDDFRLWLPGYGATDTRARFNYVSSGWVGSV